MCCASDLIDMLEAPDVVRWSVCWRGVKGECFGSEEKDVRDDLREKVVSLLI